MKTTFTLFAALSFTLIAPVLNAQTFDTEVQPLLEQVAAAYRNANTLSYNMELHQSTVPLKAKVVFQKPDKLSATIEQGDFVGHVVSDGVSVYTDSSRDKTTYIKQPFTKFSDAINVLSRNGGMGMGSVVELLTSPVAEKQIIHGKATLAKKLADAKIGGDTCDVIEAIRPNTNGDGTSIRYLYSFGKQDHLLRQFTIGLTTAAKPTIVETYSNVNLTPVVSSADFQYNPIAGAKAVDPPKPKPMFDPRLTVGADPIAIKGNDMDGKPVSLDQFKGKVVLLDFWATWCGPCVAELPNVIAAYGKYHSQGFEVVGISLDQANQKEKVVKFTQDKKMTWQQIYDGKYWQADNAVAFGVHSIPFTLLIGKDGKIAAVGARGEALAPAIEAALKK